MQVRPAANIYADLNTCHTYGLKDKAGNWANTRSVKKKIFFFLFQATYEPPCYAPSTLHGAKSAGHRDTFPTPCLLIT